MDVIIIETGVRESLNAIDASTGCDYTRDLIGNTGALTNGQFVQVEDTGVYLCSQAEYDWWAKVICDYNEASELVEEADQHGLWTDELKDEYCRIECNDMDTHAAACVEFAKRVVGRGE